MFRVKSRLLSGAPCEHWPESRNGMYLFLLFKHTEDWPDTPVDEDSPLWDGDPNYNSGISRWGPDAYGRLKVGCEIACREVFAGDRLLIVRLHEMLGPCEYVGPLKMVA